MTLPLVKPGIFSGALFSLLISFDNVPVSFFFGAADSTTLPIVILSHMENQFAPSIAAVQMAIAFVALFIVQRLFSLKGDRWCLMQCRFYKYQKMFRSSRQWHVLRFINKGWECLAQTLF